MAGVCAAPGPRDKAGCVCVWGGDRYGWCPQVSEGVQTCELGLCPEGTALARAGWTLLCSSMELRDRGI